MCLWINNTYVTATEMIHENIWIFSQMQLFPPKTKEKKMLVVYHTLLTNRQPYIICAHHTFPIGERITIKCSGDEIELAVFFQYLYLAYSLRIHRSTCMMKHMFTWYISKDKDLLILFFTSWEFYCWSYSNEKSFQHRRAQPCLRSPGSGCMWDIIKM